MWTLYDLKCGNVITNDADSNQSGNQSSASPSTDCTSFLILSLMCHCRSKTTVTKRKSDEKIDRGAAVDRDRPSPSLAHFSLIVLVSGTEDVRVHAVYPDDVLYQRNLVFVCL